jgi:hypothetical protein
MSYSSTSERAVRLKKKRFAFSVVDSESGLSGDGKDKNGCENGGEEQLIEDDEEERSEYYMKNSAFKNPELR